MLLYPGNICEPDPVHKLDNEGSFLGWENNFSCLLEFLEALLRKVDVMG